MLGGTETIKMGAVPYFPGCALTEKSFQITQTHNHATRNKLKLNATQSFRGDEDKRKTRNEIFSGKKKLNSKRINPTSKLHFK